MRLSGVSRAPLVSILRSNPCFRRWALRVLVAAWVCANGPQAAIYEVVLWAREAVRFEHQASLREQVAAALAGRAAAPSAARLAAAPKPERTEAETAPVQSWTKADLGSVPLVETILHQRVPGGWPRVGQRIPEPRYADVPRTPPRFA